MPAADPETTHDLLIRPRDPLIVRDGRPFAATPGARAVSLPWPLPSTVAGALRTHIGNSLGFDWDWRHGGDGPARARAIGVAGPLGLIRRPGEDGWTVAVPAPRDALVVRPAPEAPPRLLRLRPEALPQGAGCDTPHPGLLPLLPPSAEETPKPESDYQWWPLPFLVEWLAEPEAERTPPEQLGHPPREARVHVAIDRERETAVRGALFVTEGLSFGEGLGTAGASPARALLCRVQHVDAAWQPGETFITVGGERRAAMLGSAPVLWPALPPSLAERLASSRRLRLVLATPALFGGGWRPGWIDAGAMEGSPPTAPSLRLRLIGAAVGRREPVSGWNLETGAPRAARYAAPAGSVYCFEIVSGALDHETLDRLWLASVCDDEQDRRDGFGLALPGTW